MKDLYPLGYFGLFKSAMLSKGRENDLFTTTEGKEVEEKLLQVRSLYSREELETMVDLLYAIEKEQKILSAPDSVHHLALSHARRSTSKHGRIKYLLARINEAESLFTDKLIDLRIELTDELTDLQRCAPDAFADLPAMIELYRSVLEKLRGAETATDCYAILQSLKGTYSAYVQTQNEITLETDSTDQQNLLVGYQNLLNSLGTVVGIFFGVTPVELSPTGERYGYEVAEEPEPATIEA